MKEKEGKRMSEQRYQGERERWKFSDNRAKETKFDPRSELAT